jgi:ATP/maltotriose-dependent transcriptional regulator MalT
VLLGGTREAPDWDRVARLERLARSMTAMEAPEVRAPALALLGWVCWVRGRGTKAAAYLRRSLTVVPGYRFSELFARVVESGEVAGWARRPETAWRRLGDVA